MFEFNRSAFFHELFRRAGGKARAAAALGISDKTFGIWLHKTEDELQHLQIPIEACQRAADEFDIAFETFEPPRHLWNEHHSYLDNIAAPPPLVPRTGVLHDLHDSFRGLELLSRFGAGSGAISADPARVEYLFHAGCAVVTYKTIRTREYPARPVPNLLFCAKGTPMVDPAREPEPVIVGDSAEGYSAAHGTVNQFLLPSVGPEKLRIDIRRANNAAGPNQLFILSVIGTSMNGDPDEIAADFVAAVKLGLSCGVNAFELNFSGPMDETTCQVHTVKGLAERICRDVRRAVEGDTLILVKLPFLRDGALEELVLATATYVDGYTAINSIPVAALREVGSHRVPAFRTGAHAGLAGRPILHCGLHAAAELVRIRNENRLNTVIIGLGGVTEPADVLRYLEVGVDLVQAVSIFHEDPLFGLKVHQVLTAEGRHFARGRDNDLMTVWHNLFLAIREVERQGVDRRRVANAATMLFSEIRENYERERHAPRRAYVRSVAELVRDLQYSISHSPRDRR